LCSLLHSPVASSLLGPNICLYKHFQITEFRTLWYLLPFSIYVNHITEVLSYKGYYKLGESKTPVFQHSKF
jgi:hypothetical protein